MIIINDIIINSQRLHLLLICGSRRPPKAYKCRAYILVLSKHMIAHTLVELCHVQFGHFIYRLNVK